MSSGDLPDMWVTHGWSVIRYSEYMMDLSDQPWVENIDAGLKDVISNDDGELFILPITQAVAGIMYNKDFSNWKELIDWFLRRRKLRTSRQKKNDEEKYSQPQTIARPADEEKTSSPDKDNKEN